MEEENESARTPDWRSILVAAALFSGAGSGGLFLTADVADRYHAKTAERDFALRDDRLLTLARTVERLSKKVERIDETHPPPELIKQIEQLRERVRELELKQARRKE